jgi:hypothetical protein
MDLTHIAEHYSVLLTNELWLGLSGERVVVRNEGFRRLVRGRNRRSR